MVTSPCPAHTHMRIQSQEFLRKLRGQADALDRPYLKFGV